MNVKIFVVRLIEVHGAHGLSRGWAGIHESGNFGVLLALFSFANYYAMSFQLRTARDNLSPLALGEQLCGPI